MKKTITELSHCFTAGAVGALINSLTVWFFGWRGITASMGVSMAPALTPGWLYPRIVWGGLWGTLFALPLGGRSVIVKGLVLSFAPTMATLLYFFPFQQNRGFLGFELGTWTPVFVIFFNLVWGLAAGIWLKTVGAGDR